MKLGDVVTLQRGHDLPTERRRAGAVPILGSFGLTGWHDEWKAPGPGVTVGRSGASFGVVSFSPDDYWPLNTALYVTDFHGNDERFAYYLLSAFDFSSFNSGSAQPSLNRNFIHPVPVAVPHLAEQQAIASILGALDDKIDLNRRMSETLEGMARALFKSWFVDFDPVCAEAEGRDTRLPATLGALLPNLLVESKLRELPQGWETTRLGDIALQHRDLVDPRDRPEDLFDHFSLPAYDDGQRPQIQWGAAIKSVKYRVPPGSVLLSKLNPAFPRVWLVEPERHTRPICSTEFLVLVPKPPATRDYLYCLLVSEDFQDALRSLATGTSGSHQRARTDDVLNLPVVRPPPTSLAEFGRLAAPLLRRSLAAGRESVTLTALRDTLLPKLISGQLRVPGAEHLAAAASEV